MWAVLLRKQFLPETPVLGENRDMIDSAQAAYLRSAVMTMRTPRRRISPRTKQRYRAIREFFRRTIGSTSQQEIKINSSIALNVTNLNHRFGGIEHRIQEINRQCQHLSCINNNIRRKENHWPEDEAEPVRETEKSSENKCPCTKVLYENSSSYGRKSGESQRHICTTARDSVHQRSEGRLKSNEQQTSNANVKNNKNQSKDIFEKCDAGLRSYNTHSNLGSFCCSEYSTSSFHSLHQKRGSLERDYELTGRRHNKKHARRPDAFEISFKDGSKRKHKQEKQDNFEVPPHIAEKLHNRKRKQDDPKLDEKFIADIIRRQYKPIKLFGRRDSEISQFTAPVCRDQEYPLGHNRATQRNISEGIIDGADVCSCYYEGHRRPKYIRSNDISDIRSMCDTRMYSSKRQEARPRHRRRYTDMYSDSTLYDIVPIREKSSPKSRRRFAQKNVIAKDYYKEVPPSPKTHRPRLNLKAQYYEYEDVIQANHPNRRYVITKPGRHQEYLETFDSESTSGTLQRRMRSEGKEFQRHLKEHKIPVAQSPIGALNNVQYPSQVNDQINTTTIDPPLNKTQDTESSIAEKTDKALCEIKDILQNFLQEIKKEATSSHNVKSEFNANSHAEQSDNAKEINTITENTQNHNITPCLNSPFAPQFTNPFCYPVMPMCPMNYSGYMLPSPSFSCHACFNNSACTKHTSTSGNCDEAQKNETDDLIKEIYKYIAHSPAISQKNKGKSCNSSKRERNYSDEKILTSRSVGGSTARTRRHAKIGTKTIKCYSKSCEAIGSRLMTDSGKTSATLSDTILDKLSLEVSESIAETDTSSESVDLKKKKTGKITKVLQTLGLFKKKKKSLEEDEEEEESGSEEFSEIKPKARRKHEPPFKQHLQNYMMCGQEYYHRPPLPYSPRGGPYGYHTPPLYDPRGSPYHVAHGEMYTPHQVHQDTIHEHVPSLYNRYDRPYPTAPPYPYEQPPTHARPHPQPHPQVPLCLKEIEVKSTGTQSERKLSFLRKLAKKPPQAIPTPIVQQLPQPQQQQQQITKPKWLEGLIQQNNKLEGNKGLMDILKGLKLDMEDPESFKYKTQRQLAEGDKKMRNAMLKKMFHKRNPFSPNNLVMKTLLGKDKSSYGDPPGITLKNRLFI